MENKMNAILKNCIIKENFKEGNLCYYPPIDRQLMGHYILIDNDGEIHGLIQEPLNQEDLTQFASNWTKEEK